MRSAAERLDVDRLLGRMGLATLKDPRGLVQQLGYLIRGHDHFRQLLNKCEPEHRREMYEALRPHLGFEPKPLDVYIAETASEAERKQLPMLNPDGTLRPFRNAPARSDVEIGQAALDAALAKQTLTVTCAKCTKQAQFHGDRKIDAIFNARLAGWAYDSFAEGREICAECLEAN